MRYEFDWSVLFRDPFADWLLTGVIVTLCLTVITSVTSLALGTTAAILRVSRRRLFSFIGNGYAETARNIPGLFWLLFFYFAFPSLLPAGIGNALNAWRHYAIAAAVVALTLDNGAYISDIIRAGLIAIPRGQTDAGLSSGLSAYQLYRYILLPEAFRRMLPPLGTRLIHNFKNTAFCMAIAVPELTWATQQIESITFRGIEATTVATLFYIIIGVAAARLLRRLERTANAVDAPKGDARTPSWIF